MSLTAYNILFILVGLNPDKEEQTNNQNQLVLIGRTPQHQQLVHRHQSLPMSTVEKVQRGCSQSAAREEFRVGARSGSYCTNLNAKKACFLPSKLVMS